MSAAVVGPFHVDDLAARRMRASAIRGLFGEDEGEPTVRFGRYVVHEELGRGGLGTVYQGYDPELAREVALKILHPADGKNRGHELRRMAREARTHAKLNHPNIVQIFDVGVEDGAMYIAMELISGETVQSWLTRERAWPEIVEVFEPAAVGLAAAHRVGLVHRDFKPANVMIGPRDRVRVLDFGLAKATDPAALGTWRETVSGPPGRGRVSSTLPKALGEGAAGGATTLGGDIVALRPSRTTTSVRAPWRLSRTGALAGTPRYMSPEQFGAGVVGPASDQFSYCVALYEALYGVPPFGGQSLAGLAGAVLAGVPHRPPRTGTPGWLRDVVMRGLARDPSARFPSMDALVAALHNRGRPRRRARIVVGTALVALGMGGASVALGDRRSMSCTTASQSLAESWNDQRRGAVRSALGAVDVPYAMASAEGAAERLDRYAQSWERTAREVCGAATSDPTWDEVTLDRAKWCLEEGRTELRALVARLEVAHVVDVKNAVRDAATLPPTARCADRSALGVMPEPPASDKRSIVNSVRLQLIAARREGSRVGRPGEALEIVRKARYGASIAAWPPLVASAHLQEAEFHHLARDFDKAEEAANAAYEVANGCASWTTASRAAVLLVDIQGDQARYEQAWAWVRHARAALNRGGDPYGESSRQLAMTVGEIHEKLGDYDAALREYESAGSALERIYGPGHPLQADHLENLGSVHQAMGRYEEARRLYEESLELELEAFGSEHPSLAYSYDSLGSLHQEMGQWEQAVGFHEKALAIREAALAADHELVAVSLNNLANAQFSTGRYALARVLYERALPITERRLGRDHPNLASMLNNYGHALRMMGDMKAAAAAMERALAIAEETLGPDHPSTAPFVNGLAKLQHEQANYEAAIVLHERALAIRKTSLGEAHPYVAYSLSNVARAQAALEHHVVARDLYAEALTIAEPALGPESKDLLGILEGLGTASLQLQDYVGARTQLERALNLSGSDDVPSEVQATIRFGLARALWSAPESGPRDRDRAKVLAAEAAALFDEAGPRNEKRATLARSWLRRR